MKALVAVVPACVLALTAAAARPPDPATLATRGAVLDLAADGGRVALIVARPRDCARVVVWTPPRATVTLHGVRRCEVSAREGTHGVALAGSRAAWVRTAGGNTLETILMTATLAAPRPVVAGFGVAGPGRSGSFTGHALGDADLLVFAAYRRCKEAIAGDSPGVFVCPAGFREGDIDRESLWRVRANRGACPVPGRTPLLCTPIRTTSEEQTPLAVGGGLIAVRRRSGTIEVIRATGGHVARFQYGRVLARAAALQGNDLLVQHGAVVDVFDLRTSAKKATLPLRGTSPRLRDVHGGLAAYTGSGRVRVLRLDGRGDVAVAAGRDAEIESAGLFYASGARVTFVPTAILHRRLD